MWEIIGHSDRQIPYYSSFRDNQTKGSIHCKSRKYSVTRDLTIHHVAVSRKRCVDTCFVIGGFRLCVEPCHMIFLSTLSFPYMLALSWLSQVGAFLEQMDDQAQEIVEETINVEGHGDADANLDSILAQRGLQVASTEDDDLDDLDEALAAMDQDEDPNSSNAATAGEAESSGVEDTGKGEEHQVPEPQIMEESTNPKEASMTERPQVNDDDQSGQVSSEESNKVGDSNNPEASDESAEGPDSNDQKEKEELSTEDDKDATKTADDNTHKSNAQAVPPPAPDAKAETQASKEAPEKVAPKKVPPPPAPKQKAAPPPPPKAPPAAPSSAPSAAPVVVTKDPNPALVKEAREAQKEVRTLRRHVVALNKQLESVEEEVSAQRKELDQTGGIMEKERAKAKLERDNERKRHAEEMKATQEQHEKTLMEQKTQMEQQMAELSHRLNDMEHTRMQEGGNWDKELQGSVEREQILGQKLASLEYVDPPLSYCRLLSVSIHVRVASDDLFVLLAS